MSEGNMDAVVWETGRQNVCMYICVIRDHVYVLPFWGRSSYHIHNQVAAVCSRLPS